MFGMSTVFDIEFYFNSSPQMFAVLNKYQLERILLYNVNQVK
jgi:hypothetical protein